jgi:cytochrome c oxidase cbb3-type subunit I/II
MRTLGVPYPEKYEQQALADLEAQAKEIAATIDPKDAELHKKEVVAIIAYLQRLGTDISKPAPALAPK